MCRDIFAFVKPVVILVLNLSKINTSIKKKGSKQDTINLSGLSDIKMFLALLTKVLTIYIWRFVI